MANPLLTPAEAGEQLGLTPAALAQLRYTGGGPSFIDDAHPSSPELLIGVPHLVAMSTLAGRGSDGPAEVVRAGVVIAQPVGVAGDVDDHGSVQ